MGRRGISEPSGRPQGGGRKKGAGKKARRQAGLEVEERAGYWHIVGTVSAGDRSKRIRQSSKLLAAPELRDAAEQIARNVTEAVQNELIFGVKPTVAVSIACHRYLTRQRNRPMSEYDVWMIKKVDKRFRSRPIREIEDSEWIQFVDDRQKGNQLSTRERFLNSLCAFLKWCDHPSRKWRDKPLPSFERNPDARTKRAPSRRRVTDLTPELITFLIEAMPRHVIPQLAVEWSTGARVSSVLMACRICDVILAEGRSQITFLTTKSGEPVTASLHEWTAQKIREYVAWRRRLDDREAPLFLNHYHKPYGVGPKMHRGRNKTAFNNGRANAVKLLREQGRDEEADLIAQVTQHWFRHWVATNLMASTGNVKATMDQGGWLDVRSVMRYAHDVPEVRRNAVSALPIGRTTPHDEKDVAKNGE